MAKRFTFESPIATGSAYFAVSAIVISLTRFDGGFAFVWFGSALLIARMSVLEPSRWPAHVLSCAIASFVATGLFGLGWRAAPAMDVANMAEAVAGAVVLRWSVKDEVQIQSHSWFCAFLVACGIVSPLLGASAAATAGYGLLGYGWMEAFESWFIGHALGNLTLTPFAIFGLDGQLRAWSKSEAKGRKLEAFACGILVLLVSLGVFAQERFPLLFLPTFALIFVTFRFGRFGAALSILVLGLVAALFAMNGHGPIQLVGVSTAGRIRFLQFYLGVTAVSVLPLAIELSSRRSLFACLAASEARYRLLSDHSTDIIMNVDRQGVIQFVSPSVTQLGGYKPEELVGLPARSLIVSDFHPQIRAYHARVLSGREQGISSEYQAIRRDGSFSWFESSSRAVIGSDGEAQGVVSVIRDISHRKELEWKLMAQAMSDPLTGLPNRRAFQARLNVEAQSDRGSCVAMCDLDNFKKINDRYGHAAGDAVLVTFAKVANGLLRTTDTVARMGGEEFGLLLCGVNQDQARFLCERIVRAFARTATQFRGKDLYCTVSCGLAKLDSDTDHSMRAADEALYRAKDDGRDRLALAA